MAASKPLVVAALGSRGTGKSAWVKARLARLKPARLAVWDYMREYEGGASNLAECIRAMRARGFRAVFQPSHDEATSALQFGLWCSAVYAAGNVCAVVEELAFVTKPSRAPEAWRRLSLIGRHRGVSIIGTSQRPASIDKDFLANCDLVHAGRLAYRPDAEKAAIVLGVEVEELLRLPDLAWIERAAGAHEAARGALKFDAPKGRAPRASGAKSKARNSTAD